VALHKQSAETTQSAGVPHLIGRSSGLMRVVRLIERMARYEAPVLIVGETGTGARKSREISFFCVTTLRSMTWGSRCFTARRGGWPVGRAV
jgi:hypothetical protein